MILRKVAKALLRRTFMNLDEFMLTCVCWSDDLLPLVIKDQRLRQRGRAPRLADSEVLTMEFVGTYLGLSQDSDLFAYFQTHEAHFFPSMGHVHRSTCVR